MMARRLKAIGFSCERLPFGDVDNLWARRGDTKPLLVFAGHTDVVPTGDLAHWQHNPFAGVIENNILHGRGAADMKGSLAAMVTASERFIDQHKDHNGSIGFLITSDEEGAATDGTVKVIETLEARNEKIDYCIVGEPTSVESVGDMIKVGRRGSLNGVLRIIGKQGHVAYPHLALNPVHACAPLIARLAQIEWDKGNDDFPPTTFQISNISAGTGATNMIPGDVHIQFNFRFSPESNEQDLKQRVSDECHALGLAHEVNGSLSGMPFQTSSLELRQTVTDAIGQICNIETQASTTGGTSDGRFIAPTGAQVVELGPVNTTIHKVNECVSTNDLNTLSAVYERIMRSMLI